MSQLIATTNIKNMCCDTKCLQAWCQSTSQSVCKRNFCTAAALGTTD